MAYIMHNVPHIVYNNVRSQVYRRV